MVGSTTSSCTLGECLVTELCQVIVGDVSITLYRVLEELAIDELAVNSVVVARANNSGGNWSRR
jgi:hypothetical protein